MVSWLSVTSRKEAIRVFAHTLAKRGLFKSRRKVMDGRE